MDMFVQAWFSGQQLVPCLNHSPYEEQRGAKTIWQLFKMHSKPTYNYVNYNRIIFWITPCNPCVFASCICKEDNDRSLIVNKGSFISGVGSILEQCVPADWSNSGWTPLVGYKSDMYQQETNLGSTGWVCVCKQLIMLNDWSVRCTVWLDYYWCMNV